MGFHPPTSASWLLWPNHNFFVAQYRLTRKAHWTKGRARKEPARICNIATPSTIAPPKPYCCRHLRASPYYGCHPSTLMGTRVSAMVGGENLAIGSCSSMVEQQEEAGVDEGHKASKIQVPASVGSGQRVASVASSSSKYG